MKKVAAVLALSLMFCMPALAGTITFTPLDGRTDVYANAADGPTTVRFQVGYLDDFATVGSTFTGVAQHIGVNGGPTVEFAFGDLAFTLQSIDPSSVFDSGFLINAVDFGLGANLPFPNVGTITVDATGAELGQYEIGVSGEIGSNVNEAAVASGNLFNVVPEPATLSLLALGALSMLRRRKKTA